MRRRAAVQRKIMPDAKYNNILVTRFINYLMLDGKKATIEKSVYLAFESIKEKSKKDALEVFKEAIYKVTPKIEVRSRRIGGATYQIPVEVSERRGISLALKWMVTAVRKNTGKTLSDKVYKATMDVMNNTGWAFKKKEDVFRMAESNKAFAHFSW